MSGYRWINPIEIEKDSVMVEGVVGILGNGPEVDQKNPAPHPHAGEQEAPLLFAQNDVDPSENQIPVECDLRRTLEVLPLRPTQEPIDSWLPSNERVCWTDESVGFFHLRTLQNKAK
ncbi:MAG: hypothetical protein ABI618_07130 [Nitrospirota bacterium]